MHRQFAVSCSCLVLAGVLLNAAIGSDTPDVQPWQLKLRLQTPAGPPDSRQSRTWQRHETSEHWDPAKTAVIVCDVWDRHHCLNAVRRMTEFLPRMNELLTTCRSRGATIIHAPSDCMPAYQQHPARLRTLQLPAIAGRPADVEFWCSAIPTEEQALYPIDQSDGGEDDDPAEHAEWAATLAAEGRNPGLPWQTQNAAITIDPQRDFISDRGDEVWNILKHQHIENVILVGVHTNMCVLGRPFGLRQQVRSGFNVVLMRDLTDCMYNPHRWPFVDHFTGNDLIVSHIERFVCPTITSDQILGGLPHVSKYDQRTARDVLTATPGKPAETPGRGWWTPVTLPGSLPAEVGNVSQNTAVWLRCTVRLPKSMLTGGPAVLQLPADANATAWLNGKPLTPPTAADTAWPLPADAVLADGINLLVLKLQPGQSPSLLAEAPVVRCGQQTLTLAGRWQLQLDSGSDLSSIPLPAQFGIGSDVLFEPAMAGPDKR